jgi:catechol 2,3-dioxygenase-like lactoylglutathione lyase family enzyme
MPATLPIESVNHLSFTVADLAASVAFYRDLLGFVEVQRPNFDFAGSWLYNHGIMIHLIQDEAPPPAVEKTIRPRANHVALHTGDMDAVEQLLEAHGVTFRKSQVPGRPIKQVFFLDPDGNHIEIGTYGPTPPPLAKE